MDLHFNKQQIDEIEQALIARAKKDSSFPRTESLSADDLVPIIQNGKNYVTPASEFWDAVSEDMREYVDDALESKVDVIPGKQLSTEDYTTEDKEKLRNIQNGAEVNVNADWNATGGDAVILNKPDLSIYATDVELQQVINKIPSQATSQNQLADKAFVNSSIATNTATFRGTVSDVSSLPQTGIDENDYAFVVGIDSAGNTIYSRYKYTNGQWVFEFTLNNSSFTAAQWAAIQSGITSGDVSKLAGLPDAAGLAALIENAHEVFIATYGSTSFEEIKAAYNAGKIVLCGQNYIMTFSHDLVGAYFYSLHNASGAGTTLYVRHVSPSNVWSNSSVILEEYRNKINSLNYTNLYQYPTAKAVIDALSDYLTSDDALEAETVSGVAYTKDQVDALLETERNAAFKQGVISQTQTWTRASDGGYDYTMNNIVRGGIPGAFIDQWNAACKVTRKNASGVVTMEVLTYGQFNEATGYFELNGLTDISYEEALKIYNFTPRGTRTLQKLFYGVRDVRTNLPFSWYSSDGIALDNLLTDVSLFMAFCYSSVEIFSFPTYTDESLAGKFSSIDYILHQCVCCRSIKNRIDLTRINAIANTTFHNAFRLEDIRLYNLKTSINFQYSSRLSKDTILYLINNESATSAIVITLHPTVYAKCVGGEWDNEIGHALQDHQEITLASA